MSQAERERAIRNYLNGQETPEGKALFNQWADRLFADDEFMSSLSPAQVERFEQEIWAGIEQRVTISDHTDRPPGRVLHLLPTWRYAVAASVGLLLLTSFLVWTLTGSDRARAVGSLTNYRTVSVPTGERLVVTLPDSTKITLNAGSSLRYPETLTGNTRQVFLDGEGFFDVTPNPQKPFIVSTRTLTTTVKGTSFNVKAYPDETAAEVTVLTGKVEVAANKGAISPVLLLPTDQVTYARGQGAFTRQTIASPLDAIAWRQGTLVFRRTPVQEIARQLQRQYGVRIRFSNESLLACTLVARFDRATLKEVLMVLCSSIGATYQQNGKEILIMGNGC